MKNYLIIFGVIILGIIGLVLLFNQPSEDIIAPTQTGTNVGTNPASSPAPTPPVTFATPKKSAHYESNTPAHGAILAAAPINVVIDFNFDLAKPSEMKIFKDDKDIGVGETIIDSNKLAMRRAINADATDGLYIVKYHACWPDESCHDGHFQFAIDRSQASRFDNQTNKKEVTIQLSNIQFTPQTIKISKETKVTWINDDTVEHYINTDSHPAHTYYLGQNSKALKKGESFSLTFDKTGIYPYHCSAHADVMKGILLVE